MCSGNDEFCNNLFSKVSPTNCVNSTCQQNTFCPSCRETHICRLCDIYHCFDHKLNHLRTCKERADTYLCGYEETSQFDYSTSIKPPGYAYGDEIFEGDKILEETAEDGTLLFVGYKQSGSWFCHKYSPTPITVTCQYCGANICDECPSSREVFRGVSYSFCMNDECQKDGINYTIDEIRDNDDYLSDDSDFL